MAWIMGAAILGGALLSSQASKGAAQTQAGAAGQASDVQRQMFEQTQANLQPYMQEGQIGLNQINRMMPQFTQPFGMQQFQESPAYQFNLEEGSKAINKAAAARGQYYNPATLKELARFTQGTASNEFQNAFSNYQTNLGNIWNRMYGLTGTGQSAAAGVGGFGSQMAGQVGSNIMGAGNAMAAGQIGQANAINQALSGGTNAFLMNQMLTQRDPFAGGAGAGGGAAPAYDPNMYAG